MFLPQLPDVAVEQGRGFGIAQILCDLVLQRLPVICEMGVAFFVGLVKGVEFGGIGLDSAEDFALPQGLDQLLFAQLLAARLHVGVEAVVGGLLDEEPVGDESSGYFEPECGHIGR